MFIFPSNNANTVDFKFEYKELYFLPNDILEVGESIIVGATIKNEGNVNGTGRVEFFLANSENKQLIGYDDIELDPGWSYNAQIDWIPDNLNLLPDEPLFIQAEIISDKFEENIYNNIHRQEIYPQSTNNTIEFTAYCPVNIEVESESGDITNYLQSDIPGSKYMIDDFNGDGFEDHRIYLQSPTNNKLLKIRVLQNIFAENDDTYNLIVRQGELFTNLANETMIQNIPNEPYEYYSNNSQYGSIVGNISSSLSGIGNVTVKLMNEDGSFVENINSQASSNLGEFVFNNVLIGNYQVMIVEPLGYIVDLNPKPAVVIANETTAVDFLLTEVIIVNQARSKGYWKHQFDVYVNGRGNANESEQDLIDYIAEVDARYTQHFNLFDGMTNGIDDFEEWQDVLSVNGNAGMEAKAKAQIAALLLNIVSLKVAQYEGVTEDSKTAGDVLLYVSDLVEDGDPSNDELAKDLAESVNNQQMIAAGIVPDGSIIFKQGTQPGEVLTYELFSNYPNPFNPTTTIKYQIPGAGFVTLKVYDVLGNEVALLINEQKQAGRFEVSFDASNLSSGVYIYKISVSDFVDTKKMILLR